MQNTENARRNLRVAVAIRETTVSDISRNAGLSINVLGKFIRGETGITYGNMLKICLALNVPIGIIGSDHGLTPERIRLHNILAEANDKEAAKIIADVKQILD